MPVSTSTYYVTAGTPPVTPAYHANWNDTTNAARYVFAATGDDAGFSTRSATKTGGTFTPGRNYLLAQIIGPVFPLGKAVILTGLFRAYRTGGSPVGDSAAESRVNVISRVVDSSGNPVSRAQLSVITTDPVEYYSYDQKLLTSLNAHNGPNSYALVAQLGQFAYMDYAAGDRFVLEVGVRLRDPLTVTGILQVGHDAAEPDLSFDPASRTASGNAFLRMHAYEAGAGGSSSSYRRRIINPARPDRTDLTETAGSPFLGDSFLGE